MLDLQKVPGTRVLCPEDCRYRSKLAPFCGYCLPAVMKKIEMEKIRKENDDGKKKENREPDGY